MRQLHYLHDLSNEIRYWPKNIGFLTISRQQHVSYFKIQDPLLLGTCLTVLYLFMQLTSGRVSGVSLE